MRRGGDEVPARPRPLFYDDRSPAFSRREQTTAGPRAAVRRRSVMFVARPRPPISCRFAVIAAHLDVSDGRSRLLE